MSTSIASLIQERGYTIGLNYLSTEGVRLWYTLADAIVGVINGGQVPRVRRAIGFRPGPIQAGLRPVDLMGNPAYRVDPASDDVFRRLVELRTELKAKRDAAKANDELDLAEQYDADQLALKILANATSYGIYIELNVTESDDPVEVMCFGRADGPFDWEPHQTEFPWEILSPHPRRPHHRRRAPDVGARRAGNPRRWARLGVLRHRFDGDREARGHV